MAATMINDMMAGADPGTRKILTIMFAAVICVAFLGGGAVASLLMLQHQQVPALITVFLGSIFGGSMSLVGVHSGASVSQQGTVSGSAAASATPIVVQAPPANVRSVPPAAVPPVAAPPATGGTA